MLRWFALAAAPFLLCGTAAAGQGDPAEGRKLARQHCARCHVIKSYNPYGGAGNTPSFDRLVTWDDGLRRISTFFQRPPHPVFVRMEGVPEMDNVPPTAATFELTTADIDDLLAFAKALKAKKRQGN